MRTTGVVCLCVMALVICSISSASEKDIRNLNMPTSGEWNSIKSCEWVEGVGVDPNKPTAEGKAIQQAAFFCAVLHGGQICIFDSPIYCVYDLGQQAWVCTARGYCCDDCDNKR